VIDISIDIFNALDRYCVAFDVFSKDF